MSNSTIDILKAKWFELAPKEDYPKTPEITKTLDDLQNAIKKLSEALEVIKTD